MTVGIPFGNYRLVRRLARGGMAEVFLATQSGMEGFERTVAVKRILPHLADSPQFVEMFMDEARLAAQLSHPNIAHIYEFGRVDDSYFIAMEYIDGMDLSAVVLDGIKQPLPVEHAARIIADVCAALHYAHSVTGKDGRPLSLVHRDISPQNILVAFTGAVKVVDFGIAKAAIHIERTRPGVVRGKYTYMSPEQVEGKPLDGRTDLFCAGIVLYELCTCEALFPRNDAMASMRRIRSGEIPKPTRAGVPMPPKLESILMRSLARRREDRYRNAAEMQMELEEYLRSATLISNSIVLGEYFTQHYRRFRPTPEEVRSSPDVRDRTAGVKGTAQVAPRPARPPDSDDEETLIIDDPSSPGRPAISPLLLRPPSAAAGSRLHLKDTLIKPGSVVTRDDRYLPSADSPAAAGPLSEPPEPKTLAFTSRSAPELKSLVAAAVGGEIVIASGAVPVRREATPPGVTIDPGIASLSTIIEPADPDEDTKTLPPERLRKPASRRAWHRVYLGRLVILGLVGLVGAAGILTGHWLSAVPDPVPQRPDQGMVQPGSSLGVDLRALAVAEADSAALPSPATLRVLTQPEGASVIIDGVEIPGTTPLRHQLPPGPHTVIASYPGFEDASRMVRAEAGQDVMVKLSLRQLPGEQVVSLKRHGNKTKKRFVIKKVVKTTKVVQVTGQGLLSITTIPWSRVYLGDRKLGDTPFANVAVPAGSHKLRFVDEKGQSFHKAVTVTPDRVTKLSFRLPGG